MNNLLKTLRRERKSDRDRGESQVNSIESTAYHQKPKELRFCLDCESVYKDNIDRGESQNQCPSCTSHVFMPLSFFTMYPEKFKGLKYKKKLKEYLIKWIHYLTEFKQIDRDSEKLTEVIRDITRMAVQYGFMVDPKKNPNRPAGFPITYEELTNHPALVGYYDIKRWMSELISVWNWQKFLSDLDWFLEDPKKMTTTYVDGLINDSVSSKENSRALLRAINRVLLDISHRLTVSDGVEDRG